MYINFSGFRKAMVNNKEMAEGTCYFLKFKENGIKKWCHTMVDRINEDTIVCRVDANAKPMEIKHQDILEFRTDNIFSNEIAFELAKGNIIEAKRLEE